MSGQHKHGDHRQDTGEECVPNQQRFGVARTGFSRFLKVLPCGRSPINVIRPHFSLLPCLLQQGKEGR